MQAVVPMLHVPDVEKTAEWYRTIGFTVGETYSDCGEMTFAQLFYGGSEVLLSAGGVASAAERREVDLYVRVNDVASLFEQLRDRVEVVVPLYDAFYGMREFIIRDYNRFWITFGEPIPA